MNAYVRTSNYNIASLPVKFSSISSAVYAGAKVFGWNGSNEVRFFGIDTSKVTSMRCNYDDVGNMDMEIEAYAQANIGYTITVYAGNVCIGSGQVVSVERINDRLYRIRVSRKAGGT
jgi:hypothetical protein